MKKRNKLLTLLLCAALITVNLPVSSSAVYAAGDAAEPSKAAYADKKGLQENYDLVDGQVDGVDNKPVQKVYFGYAGDGDSANKTPQVWKIAGKDTEIVDGEGKVTDNIVLFADSAIKTPGGGADGKINFLKGWTNNPDDMVRETGEAELKSLGITYSSYPREVYVNHYGRSTLRSELREMLKNPDGTVVTKYFTEAQQKLMNETKITTKDTKNSVNYTTTDILYAPYGYFDLDKDPSNNPDCQYVTVGTNNKGDNLNDGLKIDKRSWPSTYFWLRAPNVILGANALVADLSRSVISISVDIGSISVVPAFDLNLTDVLFASKATAATQSADAEIDEKDTMTLRWKDTGNKIKSTATATKKAVNLTNKDGANEVYLCVQGNNDGTDWIWSKKVNEISENKVDAQTIANDIKTSKTLTDTTALDLTTCQIWLETTTDGLTYAKQAQTGTDGQSQGNNSNKGINTGDESNPALWITLMLIALAGAGGTALYSKKKKAK